MVVVHYYREPGLSSGATAAKLKELRGISTLVAGLTSELCYNVELVLPLTPQQQHMLSWVLAPPFQPANLRTEPCLHGVRFGSLLVEIGPRLNFSTAFSSNAVSICHAVGLTQVTRLELSTRYLIRWEMDGIEVSKALSQQVTQVLYDRMTECVCPEPIKSFDHGIKPVPWFSVDVMGRGRSALEDVNQQLGLAFDDWDLDYYTQMFRDKLKRNPTSVECFDLAQSNSEHSRHWFFKGRMFLNKKEEPQSLIDMIIKTQDTSNPNNVIKFSDNSSAIEGFDVAKLRPRRVDRASYYEVKKSKSHLIFTAETHNFPTGVAPFSGATTGTGGRIRDVQAVGRGGHCIAGTAGYSVGNLFIPDYRLSWEDKSLAYPPNLASPLDILVEASSGASDYGNKFGEPLICGFTRSFGQVVSDGERREWVKPIMFSGGLGTMEADMVDKMKPQQGMRVVKVGGPAYRIGVGGGSASSVQVQGDNQSELDFGAVQRGDPEMEQKMNRVIRACIESPEGNPICSIHDQGAGGNGNVLKELVEEAGAVLYTERFLVGDNSLSTLELWGAEYQENNALLCREQHMDLLAAIAARERCPLSCVGTVINNGRVILSEEEVTDESDKKYIDGSYTQERRDYPFNLEMELVLGKMPQKVFYLERKPTIVCALSLDPSVPVVTCLDRVLRHPTVCSKRFLTNKVDRCVTGLVARQQCVGPLHTPLSDPAVTAISHFATEGIATAIGEQPIKGLIDPAAGARMAVAEALTNLVFAKISDIQDVKCSGNWMWAAKLPGEGAALFTACEAMCQLMLQLGVAVDGGKDSLSMAARVGSDTVKAPGCLVVSAYAPCPDVRYVLSPDLKVPRSTPGAQGVLLHVDLSGGKARLGGSALAQCYAQLGDMAPDCDDPVMLKQAFISTQQLIAEGKIVSGHDISDGGLVTCLLEMAFSGVTGLAVRLARDVSPLEALFAEELGWVLEAESEHADYVVGVLAAHGVPCSRIGRSVGTGMQTQVLITDASGAKLLDASLITLLKMWEETSYRLERRQANTDCIRQEYESLPKRLPPLVTIPFDTELKPAPSRPVSAPIRVAVLREEGSNGDREMAASLYMAGFEVWDVTMQDLASKQIVVDNFRGLIFPGGFSYADVLGSAKGWAAGLVWNTALRDQFDTFRKRVDTFSLGVCNGCQLISLLGFVDTKGAEISPEVVLDQNLSERFECRWSSIRIDKSPSVLLAGMEGSVMGVWIAHGEGRFSFRTADVYLNLENSHCMPIKYTDDVGKPTEHYPMNPNGSPGGVAGVCSVDGRHLAMMPHPERCTLMWQWPYIPPQYKQLTVSPWLRMFHNAFVWCCDNALP